jgi:hypothetical protein
VAIAGTVGRPGRTSALVAPSKFEDERDDDPDGHAVVEDVHHHREHPMPSRVASNAKPGRQAYHPGPLVNGRLVAELHRQHVEHDRQDAVVDPVPGQGQEQALALGDVDQAVEPRKDEGRAVLA